MKRIIPRLSASLLIVDPSETEPRFLFGRRHARHVFMPNRYVFPGGKVDRVDTQAEAKAQMNASDRAIIEAALNGQHRAKGAQAIAHCAVRETWEETGHLLGNLNAIDHEHSQWQGFVENKLVPGVSSLRLLARAITPTRHVRRYDAWFFMAFKHEIALSIDVCGPDSELDHQIWASEAESHAFDLPSITRMILREAVQRLAVDPELTGNAPVPMFATRGHVTSRKVLNP
jgi:8-oxo-dGTP pyrophosphatase MutT (NUDIX family)